MTKRLICLKSIVLLTFMLTCNIFGQVLEADINVPADYSTIQAAVNAANPSNVIRVADGTYTENVVISTDGIILLGANENNSGTDIRGDESMIEAAVVGPTITINAENVLIAGFTITHSSIADNSDIGILVNTKDEAKIFNNIIHTNSVAVELLDAGDSRIEGNLFTGNVVGLYLEGTTDGTNTDGGNNGPFYSLSLGNYVSGNTITNSFISGGLGGWGIYVDAACENNDFNNNIITNNASNGYYAWKASNNELTSNTVSNNGQEGIHLMGSSGNTIEYNTISSNGASGLWLRSGALSSTNNTIEYNEINGNTIGIQLTDDFSSNDYIGFVSGNSIFQNIITGNTTAGLVTEDLPSGSLINTESNWWGASSGPLNVISNPTGTGNSVSENVDYSPWLADESGSTNGYITDPTDPASLGNVLVSVSPGDVINLNGGSYSAVSLATDGITLIGNGATIDHGSPAITVNSNNVTIIGFSFSFGTADFAIDVQSGTNITISDCDFLTTNGVVNNGTGTVNAVDNFWGSLTGPTIASNPSGVGAVASNVLTGTLDYFPWWSDLTHTTHTKLPYLTNPINGLTGVSVEPTLTWGAWIDALSYELVIDDNSDFSSPIYQEDQGLLLSKTMTEEITNFPLANNTMYYWKVVMDVGGTDYDSDTFHFTTIPAVPITKSLPLDLAIVNMSDVTFYWFISGLPGSMKYKIQVEESTVDPDEADWATVSPEDFEATTLVPNKLFTLKEGFKYYWRVILLTDGDEVINYSSTWSFTTGGGVSVTPIPSWPVGGTIVQTNTPTFYWYTSAFAGAAEYQVKYHTNGTIGGLTDTLELDAGTKYPTDGGMADSASTNLYLKTPTLLAGKTYYWQARTYDATTEEYGAWSVVSSFVTNGTGTLVKPTLSYPTGGVTQYTTAPTLYWYIGALGSGLTYDVYYREFGGVYNVVALHEAADLSYQLTGLEAGKTYEWYVEANNNLSTLSSDTTTFVITGGVSNGYPVITWPVNNPTMYSTKPTINWFIEGSSLGLTDVELRYKEGSNSVDWSAEAVGTVIPLPANSYTFTFDLNEGSTYYFALASKDASGNYSVWDEDSFTVYNAADNISDPVLTAPVGGISLATDSPTLYWYVLGDYTAIASYEVSYSISDVFASPTTVSGVTDPYLALSSLTPGATYYWKVRALYTNASYSNYSATETFVITPGAFAIQPLVGGPNNVVVNTTSPTISWVFPAEHSSTLKSELLISDNPDMMNAITIENIENSKYDVSNLEMGKSYFWKVRTKTMDNSYSEYSGQGIFKVGGKITDVAESIIIPEKFKVSQNYPNPFNPSTVINYSLPEADFVSIRVYNMLGQEIATLLNEEVNAGVYKVTWNGVDNSGVKVATGTYIYRVVAGSNIITKKMMLLK